jgi:thymidylate kinase
LNPSEYFVVAAYLAHPYLDIPDMFHTKLEEDGFDSNLLHSTLKANKTLFRTLAQITSSPSCLPLKKSVLGRFVDEKEAFHRSHAFLQFVEERVLQVAEALEDNNIQSIFLKSFNSLPVDSDNFDIMVKDEALPKSCELLKNLGYVEVAWVKEPYKRLFRKVRDAEDCLAIHLHTKMAWDGVEFVNCSDLWNMHVERKINGVTVGFPSREHHMLITSAHAFFENHCLKLGDLIYTVEDADIGHRIDWNYLRQWVTTDNWATPFYALLQFQDYLHERIFNKKMFQTEDYVTAGQRKTKQRQIVQGLVARFNATGCLPLSIPISAVSRFLIKKIIGSADLSRYEKLHRIMYNFGQFATRRIFGPEKHPVFLVSFSGEDGSGKTTHAYNLWKELQSRGLRTAYIWSRGTGISFEPFMRLARKLLLGRAQTSTDDIYGLRREKTLNVRPIRILWGYLATADHLLQILVRVRASLLMNNIVICDRYIFDSFVDARYDLCQDTNPIVEEVLGDMVPSPAVIFLLESKLSEPRRNDSQMSSRVLNSKREVYRSCLSKKDFVVIDTSDLPSKNSMKILSAVLNIYYSGR